MEYHDIDFVPFSMHNPCASFMNADALAKYLIASHWLISTPLILRHDLNNINADKKKKKRNWLSVTRVRPSPTR